MSKGAGLSKLGPPNLHERPRTCACAVATMVREDDDDGEELVRCLKCGYEVEVARVHGN